MGELRLRVEIARCSLSRASRSARFQFGLQFDHIGDTLAAIGIDRHAEQHRDAGAVPARGSPLRSAAVPPAIAGRSDWRTSCSLQVPGGVMSAQSRPFVVECRRVRRPTMRRNASIGLDDAAFDIPDEDADDVRIDQQAGGSSASRRAQRLQRWRRAYSRARSLALAMPAASGLDARRREHPGGEVALEIES